MWTLTSISGLFLFLNIASGHVHQSRYPANEESTLANVDLVKEEPQNTLSDKSLEKPCHLRQAIQRRSPSPLDCQPRAYFFHLNHDPQNFAFYPSGVEVLRCSGSCDSDNMEKRCLPNLTSVRKFNVTVQKLKVNKDTIGPDCEMIDVEVEDHKSCVCGKPSEKCLQSRDLNKKTCEERERPYGTHPAPDYVRYRWNANECMCVKERFHFPNPSI